MSYFSGFTDLECILTFVTKNPAISLWYLLYLNNMIILRNDTYFNQYRLLKLVEMQSCMLSLLLNPSWEDWKD